MIFFKNIFFKTGLLLLLWIPVCVSAKKQPSRIQLNMNTDWAFFRGEVEGGEDPLASPSGWMPVVVPHIMQLEPKHCGGDGIYDGIGWYRRYFKLPDAYRGKRITLHFEGVMNASEVFVNGEKVTVHHGGYVGFTVDISDRVKFGETNLLSVRVSAAYDPLTPPGKPQERMDFYYYSGIYRDVEMIVTDRLHITDALEANKTGGGGLFVTYPEVNKKEALVQVKTHVKNGHGNRREGKLLTVLKNSRGKVVAEQETAFSIDAGADRTVEQTVPVANPQLWHPYAPYLYHLECRVVSGGKEIDRMTESIGIRTIRYTAREGFFINGERLYLRGANRHQAFPNVGDAASNSMQERDVMDMKKGGYNAVRAAHYPQDPAFLAACDKHGLLVVECIPGWQYFNHDPVFSERLYQVGREMIRRDRNHPSVILWETALNETQYPLPVVKNVFDIAHAEYPGDQMYTAGDYLGHENTEPYYDVFYKQVSRYPKDGNVMSNFPEDQVVVKPLFSREWGDGAGEKPRVSLLENEEEQVRQCHSRYRQLNGDGYFDWCMLDANPHMGGHFLWSYNDYARGAEEETMFSGAVDINRYPKFNYYMLQSMRDKRISQPGLYEGSMVYIASYHSSASYTTSSTAIPVFSNCDEVRLLRNGKLVGVQTREECAASYRAIVEKGGSPCFLFDAGEYEAGELKAEGLVNGKVVVTHVVRTPGTPHHLEIVLPSDGICPVADGSDMIPVYFKICDEQGTLVNTSRATIDIAVEGEGRLIGDNIRRVGIDPQQTEGGIGFAFVRTTKRHGMIRIRVSSPGLEDAAAVVRSYPFKGKYVEDGEHPRFEGNEEDGVVVKPTKWERTILSNPQVEVEKVEVGSSQDGYPATHITDKDDFSWWIAATGSYPQVVTLTLKEPCMVIASRIRFQKDSSAYTHKVETSVDGTDWEPFYERECTGWDFKPVRLGKTIRYFRLTIEKVSEGRAGLAEISLYGK